MVTRYSETSPSFTTTFCSLIHAPSTWLMVCEKRLMSFAMASSKPFLEDEDISVVLATLKKDISFL